MRVSPRLQRPVLLGVIRSVIMIPPALDQPAAAKSLRLGLLHELAHAEIDDQRYALLADLTHAVWFFLPPVWWVRHQLRLDAEFLADHRAVGSFGTTHGYAASLMGLTLELLGARAASGSGSPAGSERVPPAGVVAPSAPVPPGGAAPRTRRGQLASALFQRVQMLLGCPFAVEDRAPRRWSQGVAVIAVVTTLLASAVSVRPAPLRSGESFLNPTPDEPGRRGLDLAELAITPPRPKDPPFDRRVRLPAQFTLTCEVLADHDELRSLEVLGYPLAVRSVASPDQNVQISWHQVEVVRINDDCDLLRVDGQPLSAGGAPTRRATSLTIRPLATRITRLRNLHLAW